MKSGNIANSTVSDSKPLTASQRNEMVQAFIDMLKNSVINTANKQDAISPHSKGDSIVKDKEKLAEVTIDLLTNHNDTAESC